MDEKRDILFLCQFFYPEYISSATLPYDTAKALVQEGFEVDVLCGYPKEYSLNEKVPLREIKEGIRIKRLKYIQMKRSSLVGRLINYFSFTLSVLMNFMHLKDYHSIIVYSNPPILPLVATWASKLFGAKLIFVSYDVYPEIALKTESIKKNSLIDKVMDSINRSLFRNVDKVVALSTEMKQFLLDNRSDLTSEQVVVIPNWYKDQETKNEIKSYNNSLFEKVHAKDRLVISYFGNMGIAQDLDTLIDTIITLKENTDVAFLFAGHGSKLAILKDTIVRESLTNVYFYDFLHGEDFQDALNISDAFVVSLKRELTGLAVPSKTYSYMMAGKPIIAIMDKNTDISKDIINHNAGYSVEVGDTNTLIKAINVLRKNEQEKQIIGENSRNLFEKKYSLEKATFEYVDMMNEVLEDGKCLKEKIY